MKPAPIAVAFREVRHFKPDDWLHCEPIAVRGEAMDWTIPAHRHEGLHQFQFLVSGSAHAQLDGMAHTLKAPALLMLPPGCVHAFRYARGSVGRQITVPSVRLERALAAVPAMASRLTAAHVLQGDTLADQADRILQGWDAFDAEFAGSAPGRNEALQAHLVLLATWFLRQVALPALDESRRVLRDTLVQRFRGLVELHLRRHQPLGFYASQLKVTPDHLSRSCRSVTGLSALDLLQERMLVEARRLLAYTDAPVAEVARDLGYDDPSYFSRFFARRAGQSPQDYRSALQTGQALTP